MWDINRYKIVERLINQIIQDLKLHKEIWRDEDYNKMLEGLEKTQIHCRCICNGIEHWLNQ